MWRYETPYGNHDSYCTNASAAGFANGIQTEDAVDVDLLCWRLVICRHSLHKTQIIVLRK